MNTSPATERSVEIVHKFWDAVWNAHDPEAVDRFVAEDFVIVNAGAEIRGREPFKTWVADFLVRISDLRLNVTESFQNADGSRVASRWLTPDTTTEFSDSRPIYVLLSSPAPRCGPSLLRACCCATGWNARLGSSIGA